jgi:hypothetical protein
VRNTAQGVVVENGGNAAMWHFIAPRRVVELRSLLFETCISFSITTSQAHATSNLEEEEEWAEEEEGEAHDKSCASGAVNACDTDGQELVDYHLVLSGGGELVGTAALLHTPLCSKQHVQGAQESSETREALEEVVVEEEAQGAQESFLTKEARVKVDVAQQLWRDVATGQVAQPEQLQRVLAALDALLLSPHACAAASVSQAADGSWSRGRRRRQRRLARLGASVIAGVCWRMLTCMLTYADVC